MPRSDRPGESGGGGIRGGGAGAGRGAGRAVAPPKGPKIPKEKEPAISVRTSQVDRGTTRMVNKQNRAAESYKIKNLDQLEKGRKYRAEVKARKAEDLQRQLKNAETKGKIKGAAATAGVGIAAAAIAKDKKKKGK
jgi:hypothetical protein